MTRDDQQNIAPRKTTLWRAAYASAMTLSAVLTSGLCLAKDSVEPETDASWYQVEVVIFTQQGYAGNELPPRKYQLDFPEKIVELLDTGYIGSNYPTSDFDSPNSERAIPVMMVEDPALSFSSAVLTSDALTSEALITPLIITVANPVTNPLTTSTVANSTSEVASLSEPEPIYVPEYEKPFVKLDKQFRDLNDSVRALNRRAPYNVVFHQAWRFSADDNADDPWVLIKAGKQFQNRYQIEGSLRFYKSRFLHFQSDLWLLNFADQIDSAQTIELPAFPIIKDPSLSDGRDVLEISLDESSVEKYFIDIPYSSGKPKAEVAGDLIEEQDDPQLPRSYPISSLWVFDQSKRLEETKSYYIDHPKMGILVTIKPHEVEIINLRDEALEQETVPTSQPLVAQ